MEKVKARFRAVEKSLKTQPWFKKEGWIISVHEFPEKKPEGVTFHLFKKHWLNEDRHGIHIESYLSIDSGKSKGSYVTIHLLHHDLVPGTKLKRNAITKPIVNEIFAEVSKWKGYKFRAGKYGLQPFTKLLSSGPGFEAELTQETARLARTFGPVVDKVLGEVCQ